MESLSLCIVAGIVFVLSRLCCYSWFQVGLSAQRYHLLPQKPHHCIARAGKVMRIVFYVSHILTFCTQAVVILSFTCLWFFHSRHVSNCVNLCDPGWPFITFYSWQFMLQLFIYTCLEPLTNCQWCLKFWGCGYLYTCLERILFLDLKLCLAVTGLTSKKCRGKKIKM